MSPSLISHVPELGLMYIVDEMQSPLPLEHTVVSAQLTGPVATVAVVQSFRNPLEEPAELAYLFPLPQEAAIMDFELRVGERVIKSDLQELETARQQYEQARQEGRRAGLLEQRRPNLFAIKIANVMPGESLQALLRYQHRLGYVDGQYEFVFPMGITPKYHSAGQPGEAAGVDAPITLDTASVGDVAITLSIDAGVAAGEPASPSHPLAITRLDERRLNVQLGSGRHIPDHDFVLRYPVSGSQPVLGGWSVPAGQGDYFLASLLPPVLDEEAAPPPREFVFVLDRSGSMMGEPIDQARNALRACLRALNPNDHFYLLLFDHELEWFDTAPTPVTQAEIERADRYLAQVDGRGGTEIIPALKAALGLPADKERARLVIFLTDGAISGEERALNEVRRKLSTARVFAFGIGPSVNRAFLSSLARLGRGMAEFLGLDEDIEGAILRFQDRVSFPSLTDLSLDCQGGKVWDVYPSLLPDLFIGQPLEIVGRLKRTRQADPLIKVVGKLGGKKVEVEVTLAAGAPDPALARLWGRARLDDLLEQQTSGRRPAHQVRSEIIGLALEHRLVTPFTAFVAVDSEIAAENGEPRRVEIAQPLPKGLDISGFTGGATPGAGLITSMAMPAAAIMRSMAQIPPSPAPDLALQSLRPRLEESKQVADEIEPMLEQEVPFAAQESEVSLPASETGSEDILRWLARTQQVDGSWNKDVEMTAAALLAFVRQGHTTRTGSYRAQVKRAFEWLKAASAGGFAAWAQAAALAELAQATGLDAHRQAAQRAASALPAPSIQAEQAVLAAIQAQPRPDLAPLAIHSLADLWAAALVKAGKPAVPAALSTGPQASLVKLLAAM